MQVEVLHNQSLLDVALQNSGLIGSIMEIAKVNRISIDEDLQTGKFLTFPDALETDNDILQYFKVKKVKPATALTTAPGAEPEPQGIGYWAIGQNFKVS